MRSRNRGVMFHNRSDRSPYFTIRSMIGEHLFKYAPNALSRESFRSESPCILSVRPSIKTLSIESGSWSHADNFFSSFFASLFEPYTKRPRILASNLVKDDDFQMN